MTPVARWSLLRSAHRGRGTETKKTLWAQWEEGLAGSRILGLPFLSGGITRSVVPGENLTWIALFPLFKCSGKGELEFDGDILYIVPQVFPVSKVVGGRSTFVLLFKKIAYTRS